MNSNYYILSNGRLSSDESVFRFDSSEKMVRIPIEEVSALNLMGGVSLTSGAITLASKHNIVLNFFGYYGNYSGTFWPREAHFSGDLTIKQAISFSDHNFRTGISKRLVKGIERNMNTLLKRSGGGQVTPLSLGGIENTVESIMLAEARMRREYYGKLDELLPEAFRIGKREKRPPSNYGNCLISFGNSLTYAEFISQARKTSVNITIPFYHSPDAGRFALALDLSEVFKPGLVDRFVLSITKQGIIQAGDYHFHEVGNGILLNERGKKIFLKYWEDWINSATYHKNLKRDVSQRELIRMELHKYAKEVEGIEPYKPIKLPVD